MRRLLAIAALLLFATFGAQAANFNLERPEKFLPKPDDAMALKVVADLEAGKDSVSFGTAPLGAQPPKII